MGIVLVPVAEDSGVKDAQVNGRVCGAGVREHRKDG